MSVSKSNYGYSDIIGADALEAINRMRPIPEHAKFKDKTLLRLDVQLNQIFNFFKTGKVLTSNQACKLLDKKIIEYTKKSVDLNMKLENKIKPTKEEYKFLENRDEVLLSIFAAMGDIEKYAKVSSSFKKMRADFSKLMETHEATTAIIDKQESRMQQRSKDTLSNELETIAKAGVVTKKAKSEKLWEIKTRVQRRMEPEKTIPKGVVERGILVHTNKGAVKARVQEIEHKTKEAVERLREVANPDAGKEAVHVLGAVVKSGSPEKAAAIVAGASRSDSTVENVYEEIGSLIKEAKEQPRGIQGFFAGMAEALEGLRQMGFGPEDRS